MDPAVLVTQLAGRDREASKTGLKVSR